jgi:hypothetical protein
MKISKLPKKYKDLLPINCTYSRDCLSSSFTWVSTQEGHRFWWICHVAKTIEELPPLPRKIKQPELLW